jgi:hypothetical protein
VLLLEELLLNSFLEYLSLIISEAKLTVLLRSIAPAAMESRGQQCVWCWNAGVRCGRRARGHFVYIVEAGAAMA